VILLTTMMMMMINEKLVSSFRRAFKHDVEQKIREMKLMKRTLEEEVCKLFYFPKQKLSTEGSDSCQDVGSSPKLLLLVEFIYFRYQFKISLEIVLRLGIHNFSYCYLCFKAKARLA